ncbi:MAG: TlpA disulfide reductase family protein [Planctomycetaceae bacterium]
MLSTIMMLIGVSALAAPPTSEWRYSGALARVERGDVRPVKRFEMRFLVVADDENRRTITYLTSEDDGAAIAWPERFGRLSSQFEPPQQSGGPPVQVLYRHQDRPHVLSMPGPVFEHRAKLSANAEWTTDAWRYRVLSEKDVDGVPCWEIEAVSTGRGGTVTLVVEPATGRIQTGRRRLTLGQGDQFELLWRLDSSRELPVDEADKAALAADSLIAMQSALGREHAGDEPGLSPDQLETVEAALGMLPSQSADTMFAPLVALLAQDVKTQRLRAASVSELSQKFVGQVAPEFALFGLDGKPIAAEARKGKTLVLHFWEYKDEPLEEPYGQIGYLDFLMNRHSPDTLAVYGVAVNRRLRDPASAPAAARAVRRLKSFMNLGYEIAADKDGKVLKAFGDPTQFDADLPLWVVIAPDGKIVHYRTGYYEIDREVGLAEIDAIVTGLER